MLAIVVASLLNVFRHAQDRETGVALILKVFATLL